MVSKVTGSLTIQVLFDRLPINHLIQLQQWETVDVFGNHGLGGLLEEGTHEKSPKCLGENLGDFGEFCKGLELLFQHTAARRRLGWFRFGFYFGFMGCFNTQPPEGGWVTPRYWI